MLYPKDSELDVRQLAAAALLESLRSNSPSPLLDAATRIYAASQQANPYDASWNCLRGGWTASGLVALATVRPTSTEAAFDLSVSSAWSVIAKPQK